MIPSQTIAQILDAARIEEVVGDFVHLKKRGANLLGLCPFHSEKTPSFIVSPHKGIFKCFGCGQAGNVVKFMMEHDKLTYAESLRYLANKFKITIDEIYSNEAKEKQTHTETLYAINEFAHKHFLHNLADTPEGQSIGLPYCKERGFSQSILTKFGLGFASTKRDDLLNAAKSKGFDLGYFRDLGLIANKNDRDFDFFSGRLIFPIHSLSGKVIAFSGRVLGHEKTTAKYINSPETELYHKSQVLYGMHLARTAIRKEDLCMLAEGYTDIISMHQAGMENVVASSGTSLTQEQAKLIKRFTANVIILYDGDTAGINAALRGTDILLEQDINVKVLLLPEGHDPDSFIKLQGAAGMMNYILENSEDFIFFKAKILIHESDRDPIKKSEVIKSLVATIAKIPDPVKRSIYVKECARIMDIEERLLINETNKIKREDYRQKASASAPEKPPTEQADIVLPVPNLAPAPLATDPVGLLEMNADVLEKELIRILLTYGHKPIDTDTDTGPFIISELQESGIEFINKELEKILEIYFHLLQNQESPDSDFFINYPDESVSKTTVDIITQKHSLSEKWLEIHEIFITDEEMNYRNTVINVLNRYKLNRVMQSIEENLAKMKETKEEDELKKILKFHLRLMEFQKQLSHELNTVIIK